jgi:hypothetical protein
MELQILAMQETNDMEIGGTRGSSSSRGTAPSAAGGNYAATSPVRHAQIASSFSSPMSPEEEKDHLDRALTASLSPDCAGGGDYYADSMGMLHSTIRTSLMEMELLHRQEELENAELMKAVALSLALEEERIKALNAESKAANDNHGKNSSSAGSRANDNHRAESKDTASQDYPGDEDEADEYGDSLQDPYFEHNDSDMKNAERPRSQASVDAKYSNAAGSQSSSGSKDEHPHAAAGGDGEVGADLGAADSLGPKKHKKPKKKLPSDEKDFVPLKPLTLRPLGGLGALPPIRSEPVPTREEVDRMNRELAEKKREVELAMRQNQQQNAERRANEEDLKSKLQQIDPLEAERRAAHMREQRDKLVAKKKAEREGKVREEEERTRKAQDERIDNRPVDFLKQQAKLSGDDTEEPDNSGGLTKEDIEESRRGAMRNALARRMKIGLIESEEARISNMQKAQFSELETKLKQVEQLRLDSRLRDQAMQDRIQGSLSASKKAKDKEIGMEDL